MSSLLEMFEMEGKSEVEEEAEEEEAEYCNDDDDEDEDDDDDDDDVEECDTDGDSGLRCLCLESEKSSLSRVLRLGSTAPSTTASALLVEEPFSLQRGHWNLISTLDFPPCPICWRSCCC